MPHEDENLDFKIFVDPSCLSDPMDSEATTQQPPAEVASETLDIPDTVQQIQHSDAVHDNADRPEDPAPEGQLRETYVTILGSTDGEELDAAELHDVAVAESEPVLEDASLPSGAHDGDDDGTEAVADNGDELPLELEKSLVGEAEEQAEDCRVWAVDDDVNDVAGDDAETPKPLRQKGIGCEGTIAEQEFSRATDRKASLRTEALIQAAARAVVAKLEKRSSSSRASEGNAEDEADTSLLSNDSQDTYGLQQAGEDDRHNQGRRESTESQIHHSVRSHSVSGDEGGDSSSHHEADDDVFSDRSAQSSIGSFDGPGASAKFSQAQEDYTQDRSFQSHGRSPRVSGVSIISGLSQYDKEDFVPTNREARIPFRTPSAIRAMQMSSPTPSVFNGASPRSGKRQVGSVPRTSHFHSPAASAQYSPKGRSTPTRLKPRREAPLVLLHVTLLPLRWMWGDVLDGLDPINGKAFGETNEVFEASEHLKTLRDAWRELQDCVGETVLERGVLLPHPQDDFEVLEERLLEALELPLRRRARILECGHYLGPANMMTDDEDNETDDGYTSETSRAREDKRHWCRTCNGDIKYEHLGPGKVFRVKVYASNGLMKAGAWEACWKDMERVDVEVEPIVEPAMQAELERLATIQMELEEQRQREAEAEADEDLRQQELEQAVHAETEDAKERSGVEDTLPIPSDPQLPWTEPSRESQGAIVPSPPPSSMQLTMHASPPQPPFSSTMRLAPPELSRVAHSSRSMRSEPIDMSEERLRRDEERLREIYGDMPTSQPCSSMNPAQAEPPSARQRHPDSYIPPPSPRSPSEEAYERRQHHRDAQRQGLDNASFFELLFEAFKVLMNDPKNVAIIVLCLFLACLIIRPTPQAPPSRQDQLAYRHETKQAAVMHVAPAKMETQARPALDGSNPNEMAETTGFVATTETIANIIMETSAASQSGDDLPSLLLDISAPNNSSGTATDILPGVIASGPLAIDPPAEITTPIATFEETEVALENELGIPHAETDAEAALIPTTEFLGIDEEAQIAEGPISTAHEAEFGPELVEATEPDLESVDPVKTILVEESAITSDSSVAAAGAILETDVTSLVSLAEDGRAVFKEPTVNERTSAPEEISAVVNPTERAPEATHPCESYAQSVKLNAAMATGTSSSNLVFPVTQRTTIRVFETITETVRVSVTATETVSFVETAVPQTVEETVYETETLRVTVSIPVDSTPMMPQGSDEL